MLGFVFVLILFVHIHGPVDVPYFAYVCFQVARIKQVDCKKSTKNVNYINKRHFVVFWTAAHTRV